MSKVTMIGCDLHDRMMVLRVASGVDDSVRKSFLTSDVEEMIEWLQDFTRRNGNSRIVFAYEASGRGFGLYDELTDAGIECHVLAPTHLPHTVHHRKNKTDDKDAQMILDEVRSHVLAGRSLPSVWIPDPQTRDDREAVRLRLEFAAQRTRIKNQIRNLLKRSKCAFPSWFTKSGNWSQRSLQWLRDTADPLSSVMKSGVCVTLASLVSMYEELGRQLKSLDESIAKLAKTSRYARSFRKLKLMPGVGSLTAMVFLTELGDLNRFRNRRQLAAYLGLAPTASESGERDDRKGHISRQGPARVRHVLCQAAWAACRCTDEWKTTYQRIRGNSPKRTKIAIVAIMRRMGIAMWHAARSAEFDDLIDLIDQEKASAQAQQKGAAPSAHAIASALSG